MVLRLIYVISIFALLVLQNQTITQKAEIIIDEDGRATVYGEDGQTYEIQIDK
ncbi:MAG: hypothetical protein LBS01_08800 [Prevotellaceae bacterium]|nr:hypothetical protein [Prevotellaceae bacterium]